VNFLLFENGNERSGEGAFAEQATEQVRNLERQRKGAGHPRVAHESGVDHLADHTQQATGDRGRRHRAGGLEHLRHWWRRVNRPNRKV
jgi:hypothetical protein